MTTETIESTEQKPDVFIIATKVEIPAERIADLFVNAIECNHMTRSWCGGIRFRHAVIEGQRIDDDDWEGFEANTVWYNDARLWASSDFAVDVYEIEDEAEYFNLKKSEDNLKRHRVTRAELDAGLKLMAEKHARHFGDFMAENDDAITADVFLQLVTLKDVVYG
jgi:hypothetical protein